MLPGGLWSEGGLRRDYRFKPLNGEVELAVAEAGMEAPTLPARVTAVLAACLAELGGEPASPEQTAALCIADRQYLMRRLAALLGRDTIWQSAACGGCDAVFDFQVTQTQLPVSSPGPGYPFAEISLGGVTFRLKAPTGRDQEAAAAVPDPQLALQTLAWRCILENGDGRPKPDPQTLGRQTLADIETALEEVTPEAAVIIQTSCPECGQTNQVEIDPYLVLQAGPTDLYNEIHTLAINYHWDEARILALPRRRRLKYLDLIDKARGMTS
ncbi:MAG: hypothetical protein QNK37_35595 [Acidobacteriota bacterium]|nr:hypothetical protein [Acidobacteriota bacterium]